MTKPEHRAGLRRLIEHGVRTGRFTPEQGADLIALGEAAAAKSAAKTITDPATWEAAHDLARITGDLQARLAAGEIDEERFCEEMMPLLEGVDPDVMEAAHRIRRATFDALGDRSQPPEA